MAANLIAALCLLIAQTSVPSVVKVADSATPIPGGRGVFKSFGVPSLSGDSVAFYARGGDDQEGLYFARGASCPSSPISRRRGRVV